MLSPTQYRWCLRHNETQWDDVDQRERSHSAVTGERLGVLLRGNTTGAPCPSEKGPSQPHNPLLTPSAATHSRVQPSGLASTPTGWFTSPAYHRAACTVGPWNVLVREVELGGGGGGGGVEEPSRFREWRHNEGNISFPALNWNMSFHQHLYFILSSLGKLWLALRPQIQTSIQSLVDDVESCGLHSHAKHKVWFITTYVKCKIPSKSNSYNSRLSLNCFYSSTVV